MEARPHGGIARISVVVPTRDRAPLLAECLASIRALEGEDLDIQLIVVDDGSTDNSERVALGFRAMVLKGGGHGSAAARNAGMAAASGEFLLFVDDDDIVLPGHVRPHIAMLRRRPELMAVVGQVRNASHDLGRCGEAWPATIPAGGDVFMSFLRSYPQIGATVCRTEVRDSVGGQSPELIGDQDWDWHLRLALKHRVGFVAEPCLLFRQRPPSATQEAGEWRRMSDHRRVLWRNARAAGWRKVPPWTLFSIALKQRGSYAAAFATYAAAQASDGERRGAGRAMARSFAASPPHAIRALAKDGDLRRNLMRVRSSRASGKTGAVGEGFIDEAPGVAE